MLYSLSTYEGDEVIFNVSSGIGTSQNQIIQYVKELVGDIECNYKEARSVDVEKIILDNSKIQCIAKKDILDVKLGIFELYNYFVNQGV